MTPAHPASAEWSGIAAIMERHGCRVTPAEFHSSVNVAFHQFESEDYDREHADMWNSVPEQFSLLAGDLLAHSRPLPERLRVLDIGCGTGLASDSLLHGPLGARIASIDLLDTSPRMLERARARSASWTVPATFTEGTLEAIPAEPRYDLIAVCSVLHHIVELPAFLRQIGERQAPYGAFLHLQDPNADYVNDSRLAERSTRLPRHRLNDFVRRAAGKLVHGVLRVPRQDYVSKANGELLRAGVITTPLSVREMYQIVDIRVQNGSGVSIMEMQRLLGGYECVSVRSYGFFGELRSSLPPRLEAEERDLTSRRAPEGQWVSAVWRRAS